MKQIRVRGLAITVPGMVNHIPNFDAAPKEDYDAYALMLTIFLEEHIERYYSRKDAYDPVKEKKKRCR